MDKSYKQGKLDGIKLYADVCSSQGSCSDCLIGLVKGEDITCQEFMSKFPGKAVSLLTEMNESEHSFYNEYCIRFPNSDLSVDDIAEVVCRKAVFEGYIGCDGGDCKECWLEPYSSDVTVNDEEDSE